MESGPVTISKAKSKEDVHKDDYFLVLLGLPVDSRGGVNDRFGSFYSTGLSLIIDQKVGSYNVKWVIPSLRFGQTFGYFNRDVVTGYSARGSLEFNHYDKDTWKQYKGVGMNVDVEFSRNFPSMVWKFPPLLDRYVFELNARLSYGW